MKDMEVSQGVGVTTDSVMKVKIVVEVSFGNVKSDTFCAEAVVASPMEIVLVTLVLFRNSLLFSLDMKSQDGRVAKRVGEAVSQPVFPLLINGDNPPVITLDERQAIAWVDKALDEKEIVIPPLGIIRQAIDIPGIVE